MHAMSIFHGTSLSLSYKLVYRLSPLWRAKVDTPSHPGTVGKQKIGVGVDGRKRREEVGGGAERI